MPSEGITAEQINEAKQVIDEIAPMILKWWLVANAPPMPEWFSEQVGGTYEYATGKWPWEYAKMVMDNAPKAKVKK